MPDRNTWDTYERLVMGSLKDHTASLKGVHDEIVKLQVEIAIVKVKLGFIGAISGMAGTIFITLIKLLMNKEGIR